jgi:hypothetical protein
MKRNWWVAVVAVLGVGLAILLFPRPDTGADPMTGRVVRSDPPPPAVASSSSAVPRPQVERPLNMVPDTRPEALEYKARRATPESVYGNMLIGPVAGIKYSIKKVQPQTDEVPAIEAKIDALVTELREVRNNPAGRPWSEVEASVQALLLMVDGSSYGSDPDVQRSVERARMLLSQYHTDPTGTGGTTPTGAPMPSTAPSGVPQENE